MVFRPVSHRNRSSASPLPTDFQARGLVRVGADTTNECGNDDKASNPRGQLLGAVEPGATTCHRWELEIMAQLLEYLKRTIRNMH